MRKSNIMKISVSNKIEMKMELGFEPTMLCLPIPTCISLDGLIYHIFLFSRTLYYIVECKSFEGGLRYPIR